MHAGEDWPDYRRKWHSDGSKICQWDLGCVRPSICWCNIEPDFILMDENATLHRVKVTNQYPQASTIVRMDWPARSPDLNPIEHAWYMLQNAISARPVKPTTIQGLRRALLEELVRIPQDNIRRLISSMRRRCQAVINVNGHILKISLHFFSLAVK